MGQMGAITPRRSRTFEAQNGLTKDILSLTNVKVSMKKVAAQVAHRNKRLLFLTVNILLHYILSGPVRPQWGERAGTKRGRTGTHPQKTRDARAPPPTRALFKLLHPRRDGFVLGAENPSYVTAAAARKTKEGWIETGLEYIPASMSVCMTTWAR